MFLHSKKLKMFHNRTQYYSTKRLHKLECYLRYNNTCSMHNQMHKIVEMLLIKRGEYNFLHQRIEEVNYLDRCFSLSNPFGRFSARLISNFYKHIYKQKITNISF